MTPYQERLCDGVKRRGTIRHPVVYAADGGMIVSAPSFYIASLSMEEEEAIRESFVSLGDIGEWILDMADKRGKTMKDILNHGL